MSAARQPSPPEEGDDESQRANPGGKVTISGTRITRDVANTIIANTRLPADADSLAEALEKIRSKASIYAALDASLTRSQAMTALDELAATARRFGAVLAHFQSNAELAVMLVPFVAKEPARHPQDFPETRLHGAIEGALDLARWARKAQRHADQHGLGAGAWREEPGPSAISWLMTSALPKAFAEHFHRKFTAVEASGGRAGSPGTRFALAALSALTGEEYSAGAIKRAHVRAQRQKKS